MKALNSDPDSGFYFYPRASMYNPKTWRQYLSNFTYEKFVMKQNRFSLEQALEYMQERWPGDYTIDFKYNKDRGTFELVPIFKDEKEQLMWILKND